MKNWHTHLFYKDNEGVINQCTPVHKEIVQKELSNMGKNKFMVRTLASHAFETDRGHKIGIDLCTNRLNWLNSVKDFDNLTDDEFKAFIHCSTPTDHKYHHWISEQVFSKVDKTHRHAWSDIDKDGNVTIDESRINLKSKEGTNV